MVWIILCLCEFLLILYALLTRKRTSLPLDRPEFQNAAGSLDVILLLISADLSRIIYSTPGFSAVLGRPASAVRVSDLLELVHEDDWDSVDTALKSGVTQEFQIEFRIRNNSEPSWIRMKGFPIAGIFSKRIALIVEDISKRKQDELQLVKARDYEVSVGARIQRALLLGTPEYAYEDIDLEMMSIPSQQIDGDFYDFYDSSDDQLDVIIGDVMGKGVPAALTGAATKNAFLRARMDIADEKGKGGLRLTDILGKAESMLTEHLIEIGTFVTLVYGRIDTGKSLFRYIDCGHTSVIHYEASTGTCWRMKGANMPVGFTRTQEYREYAVPLANNDILFLFSDGISEAVNSEGDMFTEERLMKLIKSNSGLDASALLETIKKITFEYSAGQFRDDVTGISVKMRKRIKNRRFSAKEFKFDLSSLRDAREFFSGCLEEIPSIQLSEERRNAVGIAVGEAVANVLKHNKTDIGTAYTASFSGTDSWIYCAVYYPGIDFDWQDSEMPDPLEYRTGGYGLSLMKETMDSVTVSLGDDGIVKLGMLYEFPSGEE